jgi:hypothetical protein
MFAEAFRTSDESILVEAMNNAEWEPSLLRKLAKFSPMPDASRALLLSSWIRWGDAWRSNVVNDLLLLDVLSNLLPAYSGGAVRLFRGESAFNRRRRTYGMSWTIDQNVAECFAQGYAALYEGGTVLLETLAPPDAIICVPHDHIDDVHSGEAEYLVGRRRLSLVKVVKRWRL